MSYSIITLWASVNCKFMHLIWLTFRFHVGVQHRLCQAREGLHAETVIIDPYKFCHLITVIYFRFIRNTNCIGFFQAGKLLTKWHLSESLSFQNLLKNRKLLPAEKFGNILAFDKESKRKLLSLISADSFIKTNLHSYMT